MGAHCPSHSCMETLAGSLHICPSHPIASSLPTVPMSELGGLEQVYHPSHGSCVRAWGAGAGSLKGSGLCLRAQAGKKGWTGDWLSPGPLPLSTHREPWMQSPHIPQRQGGPQSWHSVKFLPLTRPEPAKQQLVIELVFQPKATGVVVFNTQGYLI